MVYAVLGGAVALLMCVLFSTKQFPAFCALCSGASGVAVLAAASYLGCGVGFNPFTCGVCALLGAPGAVGLLGLKFILHL